MRKYIDIINESRDDYVYGHSGHKFSSPKAVPIEPRVIIKKIVDTGEFRVNLEKGREETAYYTNDYEDALGTAKQQWPKAPAFFRGECVYNPKAISQESKFFENPMTIKMRNYIDIINESNQKYHCGDCNAESTGPENEVCPSCGGQIIKGSPKKE